MIFLGWEKALNRLMVVYPLALFIFFLFSLVTVTKYRQESLFSLGRLLTLKTALHKADALVLLAGENRTRVPATAMLFKQGAAPTVLLTNDGILSGWSDRYQRNLYAVEWTEQELMRHGVPRKAIVKLPFHGSGTIYDAIATKHYLEKRGLKSLIIVTSDYHTRRSLWTFKSIMPDDTELNVFAAASFTKAADQAHTLFLEYLKLAYYMVRYGSNSYS